MGFQDSFEGLNPIESSVKKGIDAIEDESVRELLVSLTSERLLKLENYFQERTGGDFAILNKEVTDNPDVFRVLRELGLAHTFEDQDIALEELINLVEGSADEEDLAA
jgi:hypothetical protein